MKCIATLPGLLKREIKVIRVSDQEARSRVASGEAIFISKFDWKKAKTAGNSKKETTNAHD
jgi:hypothetical protein